MILIINYYAFYDFRYLENAAESENKGKGREFMPMEDGLVQPTFNPSSPHLYELFAVIIHSGGAYGGHYISLIRYLSLLCVLFETY